MSVVRTLVFLLEGTGETICVNHPDISNSSCREPTGDEFTYGGKVYRVLKQRDVAKPLMGESYYDVAVIGEVVPTSSKCPLCGSTAQLCKDFVIPPLQHQAKGYDCPTCGQYGLDEYALTMTLQQRQRIGDFTTHPCISAYTRRQSILRNRKRFTLSPPIPIPLLFDTLTTRTNHRPEYVGINTLLDKCAQDITERLRLALQNLSDYCGKTGEYIILTDADYPVLCSDDPKMMHFFLRELIKTGLVEDRGPKHSGFGINAEHPPSRKLTLTVAGWKSVQEFESSSVEQTVTEANSPASATAVSADGSARTDRSEPINAATLVVVQDVSVTEPAAQAGDDIPVVNTVNQRTSVFVSYCHSDLEHLKRLQVHIAPSVREGIVNLWDDTKLRAGQKWREEIKEAITSAKVAVLLISADFLHSDFIATDELPPLLAAAEGDGLTVLPVILSPSRFSRTPSLNCYQAINPPSKPVDGMGKVEREALWAELVDRIEELMKK
jgi:hypothetical protein